MFMFLMYVAGILTGVFLIPLLRSAYNNFKNSRVTKASANKRWQKFKRAISSDYSAAKDTVLTQARVGTAFAGIYLLHLPQDQQDSLRELYLSQVESDAYGTGSAGYSNMLDMKTFFEVGDAAAVEAYNRGYNRGKAYLERNKSSYAS